MVESSLFLEKKDAVSQHCIIFCGTFKVKTRNISIFLFYDLQGKPKMFTFQDNNISKRLHTMKKKDENRYFELKFSGVIEKFFRCSFSRYRQKLRIFERNKRYCLTSKIWNIFNTIMRKHNLIFSHLQKAEKK